MAERKERMLTMADAFVVLPGGLGTMDELFEALTWGQLGIQSKPVGLLNVFHRGCYRADWCQAFKVGHAPTSLIGKRSPAASRDSSAAKVASGSYPRYWRAACFASSQASYPDSMMPSEVICFVAAAIARSLAYSFFGWPAWPRT